MNPRPTTIASSDDIVEKAEPDLMCFRIHKYSGSRVLACCDIDILGRKLDSGDISISISPNFYGEDTAPISSIAQLMIGVNSLNVIGDKVIAHLKKEKIISTETISVIDGVQHVQIYLV